MTVVPETWRRSILSSRRGSFRIPLPLRQTASARGIPWRLTDQSEAPRPSAANFHNTTDYLFLPETESAKQHLFPETVSLLVLVAVILWTLFFIGYFGFGVSPLVVLSALITLFYTFHTGFKILVTYHAVRTPILRVAPERMHALRSEDLPVYTIVVPLYREENVIPQIITAMSAIDYPPEKLDIIITLEEYDRETIAAIAAAHPPAHFKTLILPNVAPKTKPKALNVALLAARGEFLVIYDAEIVPDPDQLKKAVVAFAEHPELSSLQPRLDHYNADHNLITRLFNAEFSFYYDFFLPGLERLGFPIPLSGHSTHFRMSALRAIGGWDPYNVTEDCDLGIRLTRLGARTAVFDSLSREEATSDIKSWVLQRSRWMKGFLQTSIVHLRDPVRFVREVGGLSGFFAFLMTVPGAVIVNLVNLASWVFLALWLTTHARIIQEIFPGPILYLSVVNFFVANVLFTYFNLVSLHVRERFSLVRHSLLTPVYWVLLAVATTRGAIQLLTNPYRWDKTKHGTHLKPRR